MNAYLATKTLDNEEGTIVDNVITACPSTVTI